MALILSFAHIMHSVEAARHAARRAFCICHGELNVLRPLNRLSSLRQTTY